MKGTSCSIHAYSNPSSVDASLYSAFAAQLFSGLSRDVRSGSSLGSGWATQGHSEPLLCCCLDCVLRVVVLLEGEPSPQSEVLSALEQVFIKDLSVLCSVQLSLDPD